MPSAALKTRACRPAHGRPQMLVQETPESPELLCGNSSLEILAKRLPVAKGPAVIEVPPVVLGDSGLIENEVGSRAARNQLELHKGIVAGWPRSLTPRLDDPVI